MTKTLNGIKAAKLEAEGKGAFTIKGRAIKFKTNDGLVCQWHCTTEKEAHTQLRLFRASLKYEVVHG